jgi:hypothetical protein
MTLGVFVLDGDATMRREPRPLETLGKSASAAKLE